MGTALRRACASWVRWLGFPWAPEGHAMGRAEAIRTLREEAGPRKKDECPEARARQTRRPRVGARVAHAPSTRLVLKPWSLGAAAAR